MPYTALIVDDSIPLHGLIKTQLKSERLSFHSAYNGQAAILTASSFRPDLILLDVDMPGLSGFEVCQRLKANPLTSAIPVIFLTAGASLVDKVKGLEFGGADYIVKPFKPEELKARVRAALRTTRQFEQVAMLDGATGLWNRRYFDLQQKSQLSLARRTGKPLSCIVLQVDHLTSIAAKLIIPAADEILRTVGNMLTAKARAEDIVCRFDTHQFAMLLHGTSAPAAAHLAERLRNDIERQFKSRSGVESGITCSFGVADSLGSGELNLIQRAETALARAQQIGSNCVSIVREPSSRLSAAA